MLKGFNLIVLISILSFSNASFAVNELQKKIETIYLQIENYKKQGLLTTNDKIHPQLKQKLKEQRAFLTQILANKDHDSDLIRKASIALNHLSKFLNNTQKHQINVMKSNASCENAFRLTEGDHEISSKFQKEHWLKIKSPQNQTIKVSAAKSFYQLDIELYVGGCAEKNKISKVSDLSSERIISNPISPEIYIKVTRSDKQVFALFNLEILNIDNSKSQVKNTSNFGILRGQVIHQQTGEPLSGVWVNAISKYKPYFRRGKRTDNSGRFLLELPADEYFLIADSYSPSIIETSYPDYTCPGGLGYGCQKEDLTSVILKENGLIENLDILVNNKPIISGRVEINPSEHNHYSPSSVTLYNVNGEEISNYYTNSTGDYHIAAPESGEYYLKVSHSLIFDELYNDIKCDNDCAITSGDKIQLANNSVTENINFVVDYYPEISGEIFDDSNNPIIERFTIFLFDESNQLYLSDTYYGQSNQWNLGPVKPGNYKIISTAFDHIDTTYQNNACYDSDFETCLESATLITHGETDTSIEIKQLSGGSISGLITDKNDNPISWTYIDLIDANTNTTILSNNSGYDGEFIFKGVSPGDYYLLARNSEYQNMVYPGLACSSGICDPTIGTPISVDLNSQIQDINLKLGDLYTISGSVVDDFGQPIEGVQVTAKLSESQSYQSSSSYTDINGYYLIDDLEIGDYIVSAYKNSYISETYENIVCDSQCDEDQYTKIKISDANIDNIDFNLTQSPQVKINLISNSDNKNISGRIKIYDDQQQFIKNGYLNYDDINQYSSEEFVLDSGSYFLIYENEYYDRAFVSKIYGGENCQPECDFSSAQLITVNNNNSYEITMDIDEHFYISGEFNDLATIIKKPKITLYDINQNIINSHILSTIDPYKVYFSDLQAKYVKASLEGYSSQVYNSIDCEEGSCNISQGTQIQPQLNSKLNVNFNLVPINKISGKILDIDQQPLENITVQLNNYINQYSSQMTTSTNINGGFEFVGLPDDNYYISAFDEDGVYLTTYNNNIMCTDQYCNYENIEPITIDQGNSIENEIIVLKRYGHITGENIFDIDGEYVSSFINIYRILHDESLDYIEGHSVASDGTLPEIKLTPGSYKLIFTHNSYNYDQITTLYPSGNCNQQSSQDCAEQSSAIIINSGETFHIDTMQLNRPGKLKFNIRDKQTGEPLSVKIEVYNPGNQNPLFQSSSDEHGYNEYLLPQGKFYFYFNSKNYSDYIYSGNHLSKLYGGPNCNLGLDCALLDGQSIDIENNQTYEFFIELDSKPVLKINLYEPISNKYLSPRTKVFDSNMQEISSYTDNSNNNYIEIKNLPTGKYYVVTKSDSYYSQAVGYPNVICNDFDPRSCIEELSMIDLPEKGLSLDMYLWSLNSIYGYIVDETTGEPINNMIIDLWINNSYPHETFTTGENGGFVFNNLNNNYDYFLSTDTGNEYYDEVYPDTRCEKPSIIGECPPLQNGEPIKLDQQSLVPLILDWALFREEEIFKSGFEPN